jgi:hypothetical protein
MVIVGPMLMPACIIYRSIVCLDSAGYNQPFCGTDVYSKDIHKRLEVDLRRSVKIHTW